jgi:hypothetical protein
MMVLSSFACCALAALLLAGAVHSASAATRAIGLYSLYYGARLLMYVSMLATKNHQSPAWALKHGVS